jgi:hypothetical protein
LPSISTGAKGAGDRHARPHRLGDAAVIEHDGLAGLDVGRHRPERDRQLREIGDVERLRRHHAKERFDRHAGESRLSGSAEAAVLQSELGLEQRLVVVDLAPDRDLRARRLVAEDLVPVALRTTSSSLCGETPEANVPPTIEPMLVPVTQSIGMRISSSTLSTPDVRDAAGAAARQRETDARTGLRRRRDRRCVRLREPAARATARAWPSPRARLRAMRRVDSS